MPVPLTPSRIGDADLTAHEKGAKAEVKRRARAIVRTYAPRLKPILERVTRHQPAPFLDSPDDPAWRVTVGILRQWAAESSAPMLVVGIPPYQHFGRLASSAGYSARMEELSHEPAFAFHDTLTDLRLAADREGLAAIRLPGDAHLSRRGHEILGHSLTPVIKQLLAADSPAAGGR